MAVGYDNSTEAHENVGNSTHTVPFTVGSGSNRLLMVSAYAGTNGSTVSGITYGGVSMTYINRAKYAANSSWVYVYYLVAPASGTANIVVTYNQNCYHGLVATSFTGVDQIAPINASGGVSQANSGTISLSLASTVDFCWAYAGMEMSNIDPAFVTGTGTLASGVIRGASGDYALGADSNGSIGVAGTYATGFSQSGTGRLNGMVVAYIAPASPTGPTTIKTLNGVTAANIKTRNGIAWESVKTVNGAA